MRNKSALGSIMVRVSAQEVCNAEFLSNAGRLFVDRGVV